MNDLLPSVLVRPHIAAPRRRFNKQANKHGSAGRIGYNSIRNRVER